MIDRQDMEALKQGVDLIALVESRGIELTKNGKGYVGLCPFHEDVNPSLSVNPNENLWKCFGCGAAGDAIRFVELADKVDFPEAVRRLKSAAGNGNGRKPVSGKKTAQPGRAGLSVKERKLLARVVAYYQHTFAEDPRGMKYLTEERGIRDVKAFEEFGVGFSNGTLTEILPEDEAILSALKRIGVLGLAQK